MGGRPYDSGACAHMKFKKLQSTGNPLVKQVLQIKEKRSRFRGGAFIIEGPHLVESALQRGAGIRQVFFTGGPKRPVQGILRRLARQGVPVYEISEKILLKLTDTETPQGVLAVVSMKPSTLEEVGVKGPLVVLDGIQDPGNLGTIIRTSDAADAGAVVLLQGTCDAFGPKALRASSGSIFNIRIVYAQRKTIAAELKKMGIRIVVTALDASTSIFDADLTGQLALVLGHETRGISPELREAADIEVRIPIRGGAESLNVAASAAVALYEILRRGQ